MAGGPFGMTSAAVEGSCTTGATGDGKCAVAGASTTVGTDDPATIIGDVRTGTAPMQDKTTHAVAVADCGAAATGACRISTSGFVADHTAEVMAGCEGTGCTARMEGNASFAGKESTNTASAAAACTGGQAAGQCAAGGRVSAAETGTMASATCLGDAGATCAFRFEAHSAAESRSAKATATAKADCGTSGTSGTGWCGTSAATMAEDGAAMAAASCDGSANAGCTFSYRAHSASSASGPGSNAYGTATGEQSGTFGGGHVFVMTEASAGYGQASAAAICEGSAGTNCSSDFYAHTEVADSASDEVADYFAWAYATCGGSNGGCGVWAEADALAQHAASGCSGDGWCDKDSDAYVILKPPPPPPPSAEGEMGDELHGAMAVCGGGAATCPVTMFDPDTPATEAPTTDCPLPCVMQGKSGQTVTIDAEGKKVTIENPRVAGRPDLGVDKNEATDGAALLTADAQGRAGGWVRGNGSSTYDSYSGSRVTYAGNGTHYQRFADPTGGTFTTTCEGGCFGQVGFREKMEPFFFSGKAQIKAIDEAGHQSEVSWHGRGVFLPFRAPTAGQPTPAALPIIAPGNGPAEMGGGWTQVKGAGLDANGRMSNGSFEMKGQRATVPLGNGYSYENFDPTNTKYAAEARSLAPTRDDVIKGEFADADGKNGTAECSGPCRRIAPAAQGSTPCTAGCAWALRFSDEGKLRYTDKAEYDLATPGVTTCGNCVMKDDFRSTPGAPNGKFSMENKGNGRLVFVSPAGEGGTCAEAGCRIAYKSPDAQGDGAAMVCHGNECNVGSSRNGDAVSGITANSTIGLFFGNQDGTGRRYVCSEQCNTFNLKNVVIEPVRGPGETPEATATKYDWVADPNRGWLPLTVRPGEVRPSTRTQMDDDVARAMGMDPADPNVRLPLLDPAAYNSLSPADRKVYDGHVAMSGADSDFALITLYDRRIHDDVMREKAPEVAADMRTVSTGMGDYLRTGDQGRYAEVQPLIRKIQDRVGTDTTGEFARWIEDRRVIDGITLANLPVDTRNADAELQARPEVVAQLVALNPAMARDVRRDNPMASSLDVAKANLGVVLYEHGVANTAAMGLQTEALRLLGDKAALEKDIAAFNASDAQTKTWEDQLNGRIDALDARLVQHRIAVDGVQGRLDRSDAALRRIDLIMVGGTGDTTRTAQMRQADADMAAFAGLSRDLAASNDARAVAAAPTIRSYGTFAELTYASLRQNPTDPNERLGRVVMLPSTGRDDTMRAQTAALNMPGMRYNADPELAKQFEARYRNDTLANFASRYTAEQYQNTFLSREMDVAAQRDRIRPFFTDQRGEVDEKKVEKTLQAIQDAGGRAYAITAMYTDPTGATGEPTLWRVTDAEGTSEQFIDPAGGTYPTMEKLLKDNEVFPDDGVLSFAEDIYATSGPVRLRSVAANETTVGEHVYDTAAMGLIVLGTAGAAAASGGAAAPWFAGAAFAGLGMTAGKSVYSMVQRSNHNQDMSLSNPRMLGDVTTLALTVVPGAGRVAARVVPAVRTSRATATAVGSALDRTVITAGTTTYLHSVGSFIGDERTMTPATRRLAMIGLTQGGLMLVAPAAAKKGGEGVRPTLEARGLLPPAPEIVTVKMPTAQERFGGTISLTASDALTLNTLPTPAPGGRTGGTFTLVQSVKTGEWTSTQTSPKVDPPAKYMVIEPMGPQGPTPPTPGKQPVSGGLPAKSEVRQGLGVMILSATQVVVPVAGDTTPAPQVGTVQVKVVSAQGKGLVPTTSTSNAAGASFMGSGGAPGTGTTAMRGTALPMLGAFKAAAVPALDAQPNAQQPLGGAGGPSFTAPLLPMPVAITPELERDLRNGGTGWLRMVPVRVSPKYAPGVKQLIRAKMWNDLYAASNRYLDPIDSERGWAYSDFTKAELAKLQSPASGMVATLPDEARRRLAEKNSIVAEGKRGREQHAQFTPWWNDVRDVAGRRAGLELRSALDTFLPSGSRPGGQLQAALKWGDHRTVRDVLTLIDGTVGKGPLGLETLADAFAARHRFDWTADERRTMIDSLQDGVLKTSLSEAGLQQVRDWRAGVRGRVAKLGDARQREISLQEHWQAVADSLNKAAQDLFEQLPWQSHLPPQKRRGPGRRADVSWKKDAERIRAEVAALRRRAADAQAYLDRHAKGVRVIGGVLALAIAVDGANKGVPNNKRQHLLQLRTAGVQRRSDRMTDAHWQQLRELDVAQAGVVESIAERRAALSDERDDRLADAEYYRQAAAGVPFFIPGLLEERTKLLEQAELARRQAEWLTARIAKLDVVRDEGRLLRDQAYWMAAGTPPAVDGETASAGAGSGALGPVLLVVGTGVIGGGVAVGIGGSAGGNSGGGSLWGALGDAWSHAPVLTGMLIALAAAVVVTAVRTAQARGPPAWLSTVGELTIQAALAVVGPVRSIGVGVALDLAWALAPALDGPVRPSTVPAGSTPGGRGLVARGLAVLAAAGILVLSTPTGDTRAEPEARDARPAVVQTDDLRTPTITALALRTAPQPDPAQQPFELPGTLIVLPGDELGYLAEGLDAGWDVLADATPGRFPTVESRDLILPTEKLAIPGSWPGIWSAQPGEDRGKIAQRLGITEDRLQPLPGNKYKVLPPPVVVVPPADDKPGSDMPGGVVPRTDQPGQPSSDQPNSETQPDWRTNPTGWHFLLAGLVGVAATGIFIAVQWYLLARDLGRLRASGRPGAAPVAETIPEMPERQLTDAEMPAFAAQMQVVASPAGFGLIFAARGDPVVAPALELWSDPADFLIVGHTGERGFYLVVDGVEVYPTADQLRHMISMVRAPADAEPSRSTFDVWRERADRIARETGHRPRVVLPNCNLAACPTALHELFVALGGVQLLVQDAVAELHGPTVATGGRSRIATDGTWYLYDEKGRRRAAAPRALTDPVNARGAVRLGRPGVSIPIAPNAPPVRLGGGYRPAKYTSIDQWDRQELRALLTATYSGGNRHERRRQLYTAIAEAQGMHGLPATGAEAPPAGLPLIYRGFHGVEADRYVEQFIRGDRPFVGDGTLGNGTNFTTSGWTAFNYAHHRAEVAIGPARPGTVLAGYLHPGARVIGRQEALRQLNLARLDASARGDHVLVEALGGSYDDGRYESLGVFAVLNGWDAVIADQGDSLTNGKHVVLHNRSAFVQIAQTAAAASSSTPTQKRDGWLTRILSAFKVVLLVIGGAVTWMLVDAGPALASSRAPPAADLVAGLAVADVVSMTLSAAVVAAVVIRFRDPIVRFVRAHLLTARAGVVAGARFVVQAPKRMNVVIEHRMYLPGVAALILAAIAWLLGPELATDLMPFLFLFPHFKLEPKPNAPKWWKFWLWPGRFVEALYTQRLERAAMFAYGVMLWNVPLEQWHLFGAFFFQIVGSGWLISGFLTQSMSRGLTEEYENRNKDPLAIVPDHQLSFLVGIPGVVTTGPFLKHFIVSTMMFLPMSGMRTPKVVGWQRLPQFLLYWATSYYRGVAARMWESYVYWQLGWEIRVFDMPVLQRRVSFQEFSYDTANRTYRLNLLTGPMRWSNVFVFWVARGIARAVPGRAGAKLRAFPDWRDGRAFQHLLHHAQRMLVRNQRERAWQEARMAKTTSPRLKRRLELAIADNEGRASETVQLLGLLGADYEQRLVNRNLDAQARIKKRLESIRTQIARLNTRLLSTPALGQLDWLGKALVVRTGRITARIARLDARRAQLLARLADLERAREAIVAPKPTASRYLARALARAEARAKALAEGPAAELKAVNAELRIGRKKLGGQRYVELKARRAALKKAIVRINAATVELRDIPGAQSVGAKRATGRRGIVAPVVVTAIGAGLLLLGFGEGRSAASTGAEQLPGFTDAAGIAAAVVGGVVTVAAIGGLALYLRWRGGRSPPVFERIVRDVAAAAATVGDVVRARLGFVRRLLAGLARVAAWLAGMLAGAVLGLGVANAAGPGEPTVAAHGLVLVVAGLGVLAAALWVGVAVLRWLLGERAQAWFAETGSRLAAGFRSVGGRVAASAREVRGGAALGFWLAVAWLRWAGGQVAAQVGARFGGWEQALARVDAVVALTFALLVVSSLLVPGVAYASAGA
ncbi:hypothetical protein, partial [Pseudonocardia sp. TRM90224]|uniref:hypothetical protein n=1 Tax=Pseudonocardia sp. TRM90224 TaxID=2812678 RepID=UPI001E56B147